ncbi:DUF4212 domain-containing protein [Halobacillus yeomjeoni]|uniref:DUF4212 domain-containing protein n=1 Tax=Halobacillus yeomjeoni TaxID=311194 RepID=A0A931HW90_9BACI|nr:sodium/substrate symporter small subunit [Halobacillus yeomjeoni]MBH0230674.1 DUF4212 domain-containing protein [Halobacillus yeomjeoni]
MRKIDRAHADAYFRVRTTMIAIYLFIGLSVSFGVAFFARELSHFTVMGVPFHYYMGSQGAIVTFIILLFVNAKVSDVIDEKFGISPKQLEKSRQEDRAVNQ